MAISKSTPYVRYKKDFTSSLHLGTIHIESEYLDRTQKTTIESIHGMTWHNKVVNENKELNLLSDTQLELTELEKQYWNTGKKRVSVDEIHTLEEVEPNEDGTYTYTVNSMEGEYIEIYDGINNITSTSDGLDGQFEIVYDTTEEDINGNIALDQVVSQYEITDSGVGTITSAKSTGLTLVNNITEPSKEEVAAIEQQEGQYFTINNTVQGNIKNAILKGNTLVNVLSNKYSYNQLPTITEVELNSAVNIYDAPDNRVKEIKLNQNLQANKKYILWLNVVSLDNGKSIGGLTVSTSNEQDYTIPRFSSVGLQYKIFETKFETKGISLYLDLNEATPTIAKIKQPVLLEYQDGMENWDIPYFEGMQSVKMPALTTTGKNLLNSNNFVGNSFITLNEDQSFTVNSDKATQWSVLYKNLPDLSNVYLYIDIDGATNFGGSIGLFYKGKFVGEFGTTERSGYLIEKLFDEMRVYNAKGTDVKVRLMLSYNAETSYEPYKSNILMVNEEVELRKINSVQDELNLLTGELTQHIDEIVLNGSEEKWSLNKVLGDGSYNQFVVHMPQLQAKQVTEQLVICDKLISESRERTNNCIWIYDGRIMVIHSSCRNVDELKTWLQQNQLTVLYQLETPTVKTVDLTVQNQDGNTIPHIQTQSTTTHVSTSSDGLTPVTEISCSYDTIIKPNTTYTIKLDRPNVSDTMYLQVDLGGTMMMLDADVNAFTIKTPSILSHSQLRLSGTGNTVKEIIVLEGNRVNDKIEYFEGMKNVENPILIVSNCQYVFGKGGRK